ncbi:hypothetical protein [Agathobaculum sp. Marseille-P7918]|uniref:hypothetical protein n=1 Tax=Agathobaculum sp. Marseille-P7918 TaxID=2479843 RepID=UPI0035676707
MKAKERYPEYIIRYLRQRKGLDKDDTSLDEQLQAMSPSDVFAKILEWNGLLVGWDCTIKGWIKDIYGIDLDEIAKSM